MSGRVLNNLAGFQNRTLTGISSEDNIDDIKDKYDFEFKESNKVISLEMDEDIITKGLSLYRKLNS